MTFLASFLVDVHSNIFKTSELKTAFNSIILLASLEIELLFHFIELQFSTFENIEANLILTWCK